MDAEKMGAFIQERRKELGMKQSDLAARLHVTDKAVSRWERGIGFPDIKLLEPLAEALEITLTELVQTRILESTLPKEEADTLVTETVELIENQKKLSWRRRGILLVGDMAIVYAAVLLYRTARNAVWDSEGSRVAVYAVIFLGVFFGGWALNYIVRQLYLKKNPLGIWRSFHMWVVFGLAMAGARIMGEAWTFSTSDPKWNVVLFFVGVGLLIAALVYYAFHEEEIRE